MKRGLEPVGPPSYKRPPKARCCMKALVTDYLVKTVLGPRGQTKDAIQAETGTKIVFSNRDEYFPQTHYRVLAIFAEDLRCILSAFGQIIAKIVELGDEERRHPPSDGLEYTGKEPNEYMLRMAFSKTMSGEVIGPGGHRIEELRRETECKVFIENETIAGHQMVRVIGAPESIAVALERISEAVESECGTDEHAHWAQLVNFSEKEDFFPSEARGHSSGYRGTPSWQGKREWSSSGWHDSVHDDKRRKGGRTSGHGGNGRDDSAGALSKTAESSKGVNMIADVVAQLPPGSAELGYAVTFLLPGARVDMLKADQDFLQHVDQTTGATIDFVEAEELVDDEHADRPISVTGPLLMIYAAHAMLLKRVADEVQREEEERQREEEERRREEEERRREEERQREEEERLRQEEERIAAEQAAAEQAAAEAAAVEAATETSQAADAKALMAQIAELQARLKKAEARKAVTARR